MTAKAIAMRTHAIADAAPFLLIQAAALLIVAGAASAVFLLGWSLGAAVERLLGV